MTKNSSLSDFFVVKKHKKTESKLVNGLHSIPY